MAKDLTIVGHDPSLTGYGLACVRVRKGKPSLVDSEVFSTPADMPTAQRYLEIYRWALSFVTNHKPDCVGVETVPSFAKMASSSRVAEITGVGVMASSPFEPHRVTAAACKKWLLPDWPGYSKVNWANAGRTTKFKRSQPDKTSIANQLHRKYRITLTDLNASDAALVALHTAREFIDHG